MAGAALGGLIAVWATARAAQVAPAPGPEPVAAVAHPAEQEPEDPAWTIAAEPVERIGYRQGRRTAFEVVPLGPSAIEVEVSTAQAFLAMRAAAADAGVELDLVSGFRTAEQQRALYRAWRKGRGNKAARPGRSNHQSGRALDILTGAPGAFAWLEANAATFGFKRTVKSEPWHWEYVDAPIARAAPTRVARKAAKKTAAHAKRPARHASSAGSAPRSSGHRVAASAR